MWIFPPSGNSFLWLIQLSNFQCILSWYLLPAPPPNSSCHSSYGVFCTYRNRRESAIFWTAHEAESYFEAALLHVFLCQLTQPQIMGQNLEHEAPYSSQSSQSEHCDHRVLRLMCGLSKTEQAPGPMSGQMCLCLGLWTRIFCNALPVRLMYPSVSSCLVISGSRWQSTARHPYVSLSTQ